MGKKTLNKHPGAYGWDHGWNLKEEREPDDGNVKTHLNCPQDHRVYG